MAQRLLLSMAYRLALVMLVLLLALVRQAGAVSGGTINVLAASYSTAGDQTVIAGVANQRIRVYQLKIYCNAANTLIVKDSTPTTLDYAMALGAGVGMILDNRDPMAWYETAVGTALIFNWSTTGQCSVRLWYTQG